MIIWFFHNLIKNAILLETFQDWTSLIITIWHIKWIPPTTLRCQKMNCRSRTRIAEHVSYSLWFCIIHTFQYCVDLYVWHLHLNPGQICSHFFHGHLYYSRRTIYQSWSSISIVFLVCPFSDLNIWCSWTHLQHLSYLFVCKYPVSHINWPHHTMKSIPTSVSCFLSHTSHCQGHPSSRQ